MPTFTENQQAESKQNIYLALERCTKDRSGKPIIYTVLRSVSRSGMMRNISAYVIIDGAPQHLSWDYDRSHGRMADDNCGRWANKVSGCGMDMGFHLASNIAALAGLDDCSGFHHEWL